jgi:hypothetical protein
LYECLIIYGLGSFIPGKVPITSVRAVSLLQDNKLFYPIKVLSNENRRGSKVFGRQIFFIFKKRHQERSTVNNKYIIIFNVSATFRGALTSLCWKILQNGFSTILCFHETIPLGSSKWLKSHATMLASTDAQSYIEITWRSKKAWEEKINYRGLIYVKLSNFVFELFGTIHAQ